MSDEKFYKLIKEVQSYPDFKEIMKDFKRQWNHEK